MLDIAIAWSIKQAAEATGESQWTVKQRLRAGVYKAKKSGRRTLVMPDSVRAYVASLPDAIFKAPTKPAIDQPKPKRGYRRRSMVA